MLRYNLLAMVRRARPALARIGRRVKLREITPTSIQQANLERIYGRVIRRWWEGARDRVLPAYRLTLERLPAADGPTMDASLNAGFEFLELALQGLGEENDKLVIELTTLLADWGLKMESAHRAKWLSSITPSGVGLHTVLNPDDVLDTVDAALQQNISLVRSVSQGIRRRLEQIIWEAITKRSRPQEVARQVSEAVGIERRRALRIVTDQTLKLSSQLDTARMLQAGITHWEWVHSGKVHFRPVHKQRDGHIYTWDNAPADLPGMLPYCGCKKRAVLDL